MDDINGQRQRYCRFHRHTIIKTIQQIKSRIKEVKEDEYSDSLAKIQVCAMFRAGDIRRNVSLNSRGTNSLIWAIRGRAAGQGMVFWPCCPKQGMVLRAERL